MSLPTHMLRAHHAELEEQFEQHVETVTGLSEMGDGAEEVLHGLVHFLKHEILTHADGEQKHLYARVCDLKGDDSYTATMEVDHEFVESYVHDLEHAVERALEGGSDQDLLGVKLAAARVEGILTPHFEKEDRVFLPVLDENLTEEEVLEQVVGPMHGGHHDHGHDHHEHGDHEEHDGHEGHEHHEGHDH